MPSERSVSSSHSDRESTILTHKIEAALKNMSQRAVYYEMRMKEFEAKLSENLCNFRAVEGVVKDSHNAIRQNTSRADSALHDHVPHIMSELEESLQALHELSVTLPTINTQVEDVEDVYESGRDKAKLLVKELSWLNTEFYERWRATIFTPNAPGSPRWKALLRFIFVVVLVACLWLSWISLSGAYRAHRQRLLWGERLMS